VLDNKHYLKYRSLDGGERGATRTHSLSLKKQQIVAMDKEIQGMFLIRNVNI